MAAVGVRARSSVALPPAILHKLSRLQGALNSFIDRDWITRRSPDDWGLAITLEAAELIDSYPWKWWKNVNAPPNIGNVKVELVDILHFSLSGTMQMLQQRAVAGAADVPQAQQTEAAVKAWGLSPVVATPLVQTANAVATFRNVIGLAKFHCFDVITEHVVASADDLGFNLVAYYVAKHTLNVIRQLGGYKDGTYVKVSSATGKEDNELLHDVIRGVSVADAVDEAQHEAVWDGIMSGVYGAFQVPDAQRKATRDWIGVH